MGWWCVGGVEGGMCGVWSGVGCGAGWMGKALDVGCGGVGCGVQDAGWGGEWLPAGRCRAWCGVGCGLRVRGGVGGGVWRTDPVG